VLGGVAAFAAFNVCAKGGGEPVCTGGVVLGAAALGGATGALFGAIIGANYVRWHLTFARSRSQVTLGVRAAL